MKKTMIWDDCELRWSIDEIASPDESEKSEKLMRLVRSGKPFDIGWVGLKKEIVSFNIRRSRKNGRIILSVCAAMDELPYDLMTDADSSLTYDEIDEIMEDDEFAYRINEIETEITESETLKSKSSLEEIASTLMGLWKSANDMLESGFAALKEIIAEYKKTKDSH